MKAGIPINMQLKDDTMFAEVALKYFGKAGIDQDRDQPKFLFNSKELRTDSYKSLSELGIRNMSKIEVVIGKDVNIHSENTIKSKFKEVYMIVYILAISSQRINNQILVDTKMDKILKKAKFPYEKPYSYLASNIKEKDK